MGLKTWAYYLFGSLVAVCVGLAFVNLVQPGLSNGAPNPTLRAAMDAALESKEAGEVGGQGDLVAEVEEVPFAFGRAVAADQFGEFASGGGGLGDLAQIRVGELGALQFAQQFGIYTERDLGTGANLTHNLRTAIVDADGRLVKTHSGNDWTPADLVADLEATPAPAH